MSKVEAYKKKIAQIEMEESMVSFIKYKGIKSAVLAKAIKYNAGNFSSFMGGSRNLPARIAAKLKKHLQDEYHFKPNGK